MGELASAKIVVLDLWYNGKCGFEIAARLKKKSDRIRILALTSRADEVAMHRSQIGPLDGFVWKIPAATWQIEDALVELDHGRTYFPMEVVEERRRLEALPDAYFKLLTENHIELLPYFARFMGDGEVAVKVGAKERTVRWHRENIQHAIGATNRNELVQWALGAGFAPLFLAAPPCLVG